MVWYQQFEYAIYHWFHKATENMIGCVTGRPGCFSLLRVSSNKIKTVLGKFTAAKTDEEENAETNEEDYAQYAQYDQSNTIFHYQFIFYLVCIVMQYLICFFILQEEINCFSTYCCKKVVK